MTRIRMSLALAPAPTGQPWTVRRLVPDDAPMLGDLMSAAYRGTVDDAGETIEDARDEARATLSGRYGEVIGTGSLGIEDDLGLCAAAVTTLFEGVPLLAFSLTHPRQQRRGMASGLIRLTADALFHGGYRELRLVVTDGNRPAQRLYEKLGFTVRAPSPGS